MTSEVSQVQAKILKELLLDGRRTAAEIAKETDLASETVYKNYGEMKQRGIIRGATIHINYRGFGYKAVANLLINVDPGQSDKLIEFIQKMPDIYTVYGLGPKGNIRVVTTLKTLQQLNEVKDKIKQHFTILNLRTVIWTDVKEMHENLTITPEKGSNTDPHLSTHGKKLISRAILKEKMNIDEIDTRIVEALSDNGLAPLSQIAQEAKVSTGTIKKRYEKLKNSGLLKVTIQIDPTKLGYRGMAIFYVTFTLHEDSSSTIDKIRQIPDVISIMKTSGDYDLQVYAMIKDLDQLLTIQDGFAKMPGMARIDMELTPVLDKWPTPRQYISTF